MIQFKTMRLDDFNRLDNKILEDKDWDYYKHKI